MPGPRRARKRPVDECAEDTVDRPVGLLPAVLFPEPVDEDELIGLELADGHSHDELTAGEGI
ncbi:hypothetical protein DSECCO2_648990 [anaerobic digester metagenome]